MSHVANPTDDGATWRRRIVQSLWSRKTVIGVLGVSSVVATAANTVWGKDEHWVAFVCASVSGIVTLIQTRLVDGQ